jgi:hypothetical protein
MGEVTVRLAVTASDRQTAGEIRYRAYVEEAGLDLGADRTDCVMTDDDDESARIFIAFVDGEPAGTVRALCGCDMEFGEERNEAYGLDAVLALISRERLAVVERFCVVEAHRTTSASFDLLSALGETFVRDGIDVVACEAEPHLLPLYRLLGCRPYRSPVVHPQVGILVPLLLLAGDRTHLAKMGSPFLSMLPEGFGMPLDPRLLALSRDTDVARAASLDDFRTIAANGPGIFDGVSEAERVLLLRRSSVITVSPGDTVIKEGRSTDTLFVVLDGAVEVRHSQRTVDVVSGGGVVGEFAFLLGAARTAEVIAVVPTSLVSLSAGVLRDMLEREPHLMARLAYNLARIVAVKALAGVR